MFVACTLKVLITDGDRTQARRVVCPKSYDEFREMLRKWLGCGVTYEVVYEDNEGDTVTLGASEKEWDEALTVFDTMGEGCVPRFKVTTHCPHDPHPSLHELQARIAALEEQVAAQSLGDAIFNATAPWSLIEAKYGSKHIPLMRYLMQCEGPPPLNHPQPTVTRQQYEDFTTYFPPATLSADLDFLVEKKLVILGMTTERSEAYLASHPVGSFVIRPSRRCPRAMVVTMRESENHVSHRIVQLHTQVCDTARPRTIRELAEELMRESIDGNTRNTNDVGLAVVGYK